ncbi:MAG: hypothetical protein PHY30_02290 [Candidatus Pacebacteria bacterium]|nr:hypothetical protein [Candidatus Paceibacterota bacterium]
MSPTFFKIVDIYGRRFDAKTLGNYSLFEEMVLNYETIWIKKEDQNSYSIDDPKCLAKIYFGSNGYYSFRRLNPKAALVLGKEEIKKVFITSTFL